LSSARAFVVADLGFGDAGKGLVTDFLVRHTGANVVVRYNGGAQAGHNVVTPDGRHHTFSQFGSGTFVPGVRTFLSRDVIVHPTALLLEERHLRSVGVPDAFDRLRIGAGSLVITPYLQSLGRLREIARGQRRHGSCGVGMGETVAHSIADPAESIRMKDLIDDAGVRRKLRHIEEYVRAEVSCLDRAALESDAARAELRIVDREDWIADWMEVARMTAALVAEDDAWVPRANESSTVIFEGAQGLLLDENHGFHPHTTWSTCTTGPARSLLAEHLPDADVSTIGVVRTFAVRHGPGPFPTELSHLPSAPDEHNSFNRWQGTVRRGWFDAVLTRYAIEADGAIDALAVTHLDWVERLGRWTYCGRYDNDVSLRPVRSRTLEERQAITERLASANPILTDVVGSEDVVIETIETVTGKPVAIGSRGPSARDVSYFRPACVTLTSALGG